MRGTTISKLAQFFTFLTLRALFVKKRKTSLISNDKCENKRHPGIYDETIPSLLVRCLHWAGIRSRDISFSEFHLDLSMGFAADGSRAASI